MKRICSVLLLLALVLSVISMIPLTGSAVEEAREIQFRGFESTSSDYNCNYGGVFIGKASGVYGVNAAVGNGFLGAKVPGDGVTELHHYIYSYNQGKNNNADGSNADGMAKILITDPTQMYASLDLYVSDASVINNPAGDCGFGIDTEEFGQKENWGSTFYASRTVMKPLMDGLKDGWNHLLIPLTLKKSSYKEAMANQTVTIPTMRLYVTGLKLPAGFISAVDDVRIMNKQAAMAIYPERTVAKSVTDMIRAYPSSATYNDFYKVYLAYNATPEKYKSLIIGWDSFISNNSSFKAQGDTQIAADKAAASPVINAIQNLNKDIAAEDKASVETARAAYNALSDNQKVLVTNVSFLTNAESTLTAMKDQIDQAEADKVRAIIAALPKTITAADKDAVLAARAAYNALTPEQQAKVINTTILQNAEKALAQIENQAAANAVATVIDALPDTITHADKDAVAAAREAYNALTDDQKTLVFNYAELEAAEEQVKGLIEVPNDPTPPTGQYKVGDLDGDGAVDAKDALLVLKYSVGKISRFPIEK